MCPALGRKIKARELLLHLLFLNGPSAQNNPNAKVNYFRVAYSHPLHKQLG